MEIMEATYISDGLWRKLKLETIEYYVSLRKLRWAGHLARMPTTRLPRRLLTSWVSQPRPHGRPQYTYGHALNKTLKRAGIPSELEKWSKLAQRHARKDPTGVKQFTPRRSSRQAANTETQTPILTTHLYVYHTQLKLVAAQF